MPKKALKAPVQKRSIATRNKLKRVAKQLFSEKGFYKVTSIQIAKVAGVPVGSFYNYFGNKEGILLELIADFNAKFHQDSIEPMEMYVLTTIDKASALKNLAHLIQSIIASPHLSDPFYPIFHALQFTEPAVCEEAAKARDIELLFLERFLTQINQFHPVPNIPLMARLIFTTSENLNLYIHHLAPLGDAEQMIKEAILMFERYIFDGE